MIPAQFERAYNFADNGWARVQQNDKWGYIDTTGQWVIPAQFERAYTFADNGRAAVQQNGQWGYIDTTGQWVIPAQFEQAYNFTDNGRAAVQQNGQWGYIDLTGQWVIPAQFERASSFADNGWARIQQDGKRGLIDTKGEWIVRTDTVCDTEVFKNADGEVIWPKQSVSDICAIADFNRRKAESERLAAEQASKEANQRACDHVYVGKEFEASGGFLGLNQRYIVVGLSASTQQVTIRSKNSDYRQQISCYDVSR